MELASRRPTGQFLAPPRAEEARNSIISNMSRFWRSRPAPVSSAASQGRPTKTFVVPLFMSASRSSGRNNLFARGALPAVTRTRSRSSTRSVNEIEASRSVIAEPIHVHRSRQRERSDLYASSVQVDTAVSSIDAPASVTETASGLNMSSRSGSTRITTSSRNGSHRSQNSRRSARSRQIFSKRAYRDPQVNSKAKICFAFGLTLIVAVIIYLVLAFTGVARNTMFHVLSILLIITLTGIFCHQLIRMFMLIKSPRRPRRRIAHGRRHATSHRGKRHGGGAADDMPPEKPIQIHMSSDDGFDPDVEMMGDSDAMPVPAVQHPPPVYGNFRTSTVSLFLPILPRPTPLTLFFSNAQRMNPDLVHWKHVPPSPLTPTYDEALSGVPVTLTAAAYRPPSYLSESGMTQVLESQGREVDAALDNIHPLERERMRNLAADALEGRGPN
ncbi:hypothetical protein LTR84_005254 [Exophiala bonariae]|uniref:Uncharacterized protein n=1 Tax=Exophiala bonariae TaxID=1690606 RepID=A0AAV9NT71_9EURO|nr:hypothetical protein LTR84_005254 [Exophiala bonariae]